ncbi:hypothetical protein KBX50_26305 [Micromonospora sp. C51]|uniref:hypothetical protein n=1 Tax=Micromonospora sp. C51 TaxID=2824879 RepID=UPI001B35D2A0|nr:hypothetical protein [Micromonospora sp. C51]MBQ1051958.1 hypothetical protein [Micromonospora sp. C51]
MTDDQGISGVAAAPVWAGMQETSVATLTKVQHLSVVGPQTADNAAAFVAGLTQSQCDLVILVGEAPSAAAVAAAARFPTQRFLAVGNRGDGTPQNLVWVTGSSDAIRNGVQQAIRDSAG